MREFRIYASGGMQKFGRDNFNESNNWRKHCKTTLETHECDYRVRVFNPNDLFNFKDEPRYVSEREVMNVDLYKLRQSDLVIVNFNDKWSLGTMSEIAIAYDRRIPVIGLNENSQELHPWQQCICERIFNSVNEMLDYIKDFYLI
ncbi:MAG: nucleoside 2-deoxyribosyltransferase [Clostridia bacterium]|nr:nucleoside 2-deoxyribosyltransferase [Clostridia bacterium]